MIVAGVVTVGATVELMGGLRQIEVGAIKRCYEARQCHGQDDGSRCSGGSRNFRMGFHRIQ